MTANLNLTEDDILTRLKDVWDADPDSQGFALVYDNVELADGIAPPDQGVDPWARATIQTGASRQVAFGDGVRRFENEGILTVQIFTLVGIGQNLVKNLTDVVLSAVRAHRTTNGVIFRDTNIVTVGAGDKWFQVNVLTDFVVDELA